MVRILMVRHGQAAATFTDDADPGLSDLGRKQALSVAERLEAELPLKICSSPLKRAFETAQPLDTRQKALQARDDNRDTRKDQILIDERISEIPSTGLSIEERGPWLQQVMTGNWSEQSAELQSWRQALIDCLVGQKEDCVLFSHYVAINTAVGSAEGLDAVSIFRPDNTSVTELTTDGEKLYLVSRGEEAVTRVN